MKKRLEMLEQLQEIDLLIDSLKTSQDTVRAEVDGMLVSLERAGNERAEMESRLAALEQERADLESGHAAELENIQRSESHMKEIKTNKEYQAVGREISAARKQATELEGQILGKIAQIEELTGEIERAGGNLADLESNTSQRLAEKNGEIEAIQSDINRDAARRDELVAGLPASLVKRYGSLREQRRGVAVAAAKDGYCLGCNMNLPPQLYNSLFKGLEMHTCPHCQRVLVLKQEPLAQ